MLTALQVLPREAELLAFEAGCEDYCEREVDDEVEWQGGRVYLHLGARRDEPRRAMAEVDLDQEAALRHLRAVFGFVEVLRVVDHHDDQDQDDDEPFEEGEEAPAADR